MYETKWISIHSRGSPLILPDTQDGTVLHQDRPAHIPRSVCEYKVVCIMLVCSECELVPTCHTYRQREETLKR